MNWFDTMPPGSLQGLVLGSSDLRCDCEALGAADVGSTNRWKSNRWGLEAAIRDPDGNGLVLQQG